ncbi:hypothetical protein [Desulfonema ishimotonii]|uniref:hypothetical protein n=1 Tax=Desulfonema ishimotonii TaxID=45657 RepID=UPI000F5612BE|nr:hypothetical protein [Desulfonema ishimotonii]
MELYRQLSHLPLNKNTLYDAGNIIKSNFAQNGSPSPVKYWRGLPSESVEFPAVFRANFPEFDADVYISDSGSARHVVMMPSHRTCPEIASEVPVIFRCAGEYNFILDSYCSQK